jgi:hypothetical protein
LRSQEDRHNITPRQQSEKHFDRRIITFFPRFGFDYARRCLRRSNWIA